MATTTVHKTVYEEILIYLLFAIDSNELRQHISLSTKAKNIVITKLAEIL